MGKHPSRRAQARKGSTRWGTRVGGAVLVLTLAATGVCMAAAFACTNLATISLSARTGRPGDTITLIGSSFPVPRSNAPSGTPTAVVIRWMAGDGPVLATVVPDRTGTVSATFTVPASDPGYVVILAVQRRSVVNPDAPDAPTVTVDEPGTPARATFRILAPGEVPSTLPSPPDVAGAADGEGSTAMIVLMVVSGAVALSLFAGGVMAFLHQMRSRRWMPQPWRLR